MSPISSVAQDTLSLTEMVTALTAKNFDEKAAAVEALAEVGEDQVELILEALLEGRLYTRKNDGKVLIVEKRDKIYLLFDPVELTEVGQASKKEITKLRVNNRLRRIIRSALGRLTLLSPDPAKRMEAAGVLFQKPSPANASILAAALERETDTAIRSKMAKALAAIQLGPQNPVETRIAAIAELEAFVEPEVRSLLSALLIQDDSGAFREQDANVRAVAKRALENIESKLRLYGILETL
ncbi:MAG TPA: urea ABC transporter permease subunit UrtB, partial [Alphaproteobacteria bacterium]|nr:urea ABC transporter permease subunit UrtB [Alphaproteobacteria bacterium]